MEQTQTRVTSKVGLSGLGLLITKTMELLDCLSPLAQRLRIFRKLFFLFLICNIHGHCHVFLSILLFMYIFLLTRVHDQYKRVQNPSPYYDRLFQHLSLQFKHYYH